MNYKETYQEWLSNPYFDEDTVCCSARVSEVRVLFSDTLFIPELL